MTVNANVAQAAHATLTDCWRDVRHDSTGTRAWECGPFAIARVTLSGVDYYELRWDRGSSYVTALGFADAAAMARKIRDERLVPGLGDGRGTGEQ